MKLAGCRNGSGKMELTRVVFFVRDLGHLGGITASVDVLAEEFARRGCRVEYLTTNPPSGPVRVGGPVHHVDRWRRPWMRPEGWGSEPGAIATLKRRAKMAITRVWRTVRLARLWWKLRSFGAETAIFITHPDLPGDLLSRGLPLRRPGPNSAALIAQFHSSYDGILRVGLGPASDALSDQVDACVALSEGDAQAFANRFGRPVACIGNPVAVDAGGGGHRTHTIVYVGRFADEKRLDFLIRAFDMAASVVPEWRLVLYGSGSVELENSLKLQAKQASNAPRIEFAGQVADPSSAYESASLAALTSSFEGQPMMLLEAAAFGVPIVALKVSSGVEEIVGRCGMGLDPEVSEAEFARALVKAMRDEAWRFDASRRARVLAQQHAPSMVVDEWLRLIESRSVVKVQHRTPR